MKSLALWFFKWTYRDELEEYVKYIRDQRKLLPFIEDQSRQEELKLIMVGELLALRSFGLMGNYHD
jgi:hypothetical protein